LESVLKCVLIAFLMPELSKIKIVQWRPNEKIIISSKCLIYNSVNEGIEC